MADMVTVRLNVNGVAHEGRCEPRKLLADFKAAHPARYKELYETQ